MHLSDTLVFGPLPLSGRSLRLPVGAALLALLVVLLCAAAAGSLLLRPLPAPLAGLLVRVPISFPGRPADRAPTAPDIHLRVMSVPARATVILDGRAIGATPCIC